jgi:uncharacterized damage-inducible protein DinB
VVETRLPEPWLRGTLTDVPAVVRGVLHALELAREDALHWCSQLTAEQMNATPAGLPSVTFHIQHIMGSLDRILTYAEDRELNEQQLGSLGREGEPVKEGNVLLREFSVWTERCMSRVRAFSDTDFAPARYVGRKRLPTTVGGLLVHVADHTQRHVGQMVTTAKLVKAIWPESH